MSGHDAGHGHGEHAHPDFLAHHFETPEQQNEAGKTGMWLFLATEILLFGGLFCAYSVYRRLHPEIFEYGARFLDTKWGAINTLLLIFSSFTAAWAVRAVQLNQRKLTVALLFITILCGAGFMGVKFVEYKAKIEHGTLLGKHYNPKHEGKGGEHATSAEEIGDNAPDAQKLAEAGSERSTPTATEIPSNPPAGSTIIEGQAKETAASNAAPHAPAKAVADAHIYASPLAPAGVETTTILPSPPGPKGLSHLPEVKPYKPGTGIKIGSYPDRVFANILPKAFGEADYAEQRHEVSEPRAKEQIFFSIYFGMTGLHGLHVLIGMIAIAWAMVRTAKGHFGPKYYMPVDLVALYWHLVDLIWIYLFPLLYLIG